MAEVQLEHLDGALVAHLVGEVDLSNVEEVRELIIGRVSQDTGALVLDLTDTTYLDSTGVRLLFELTQRLQARRRQLCLVVTDEALVRRVILLTKLDEQVPLHDSVDDALAALRDPQ
ncbi:MAG: STAS domain-containing protein [Actinobacteria bacterium]|nr:STAS domain-containing protein [Actinomycetota bacterium]